MWPFNMIERRRADRARREAAEYVAAANSTFFTGVMPVPQWIKDLDINTASGESIRAALSELYFIIGTEYPETEQGTCEAMRQLERLEERRGKN